MLCNVKKLSNQEISFKLKELEDVLLELSKRQVQLVDAAIRGKQISDNSEKSMAQLLYECKLEIEECEDQINKLKIELNKQTICR